MAILDTLYQYFRRDKKPLLVRPFLLDGAITIHGIIVLNEELREDKRELFITIFHELLHLDRGYIGREWVNRSVQYQRAKEKEIEEDARRLYEDNVVVLETLKNYLMETELINQEEYDRRYKNL